MAEVTDLHVLAKMANGTPNEEDAFVVKDKSGKLLAKIHSLRDLVDNLSTIKAEDIFPYLCREVKAELECDLALWIHYVLGDAILSAKIFNLASVYKDQPDKLKLEVFNLCFNRYLNFQELMEFSDDLTPFNEEPAPPANL